jgi:hypothetical protein
MVTIGSRPAGGEFLFGRQEHPLAHHALVGVEQPVHRLEPEIRHADPVGVRKREGDAQASAVRFGDEPDFALEQCPGPGAAIARRPGAGRAAAESCALPFRTHVRFAALVRTPRLTRRRGLSPGVWRLYLSPKKAAD